MRDRVHAELAAVISWVHEQWALGRHPSEGYYGEPMDGAFRSALAGKELQWLGIYIGNKADGKGRKELHKFARNFATMFVCERCLAVQRFPSAPEMLHYANWTDTAHGC